MVPPVAEASSFAVCCTTSARRPQMKTCAPNCRKRSAMARPIPVPPPVMRMRLPFRRSLVNMALPRKGTNLTLVAGACLCLEQFQVGRSLGSAGLQGLCRDQLVLFAEWFEGARLQPCRKLLSLWRSEEDTSELQSLRRL